MVAHKDSDLIIDTEIIDLAYDGRAVGTRDGKIVFLDAGLPGDRVRAEIIKRKAAYDLGRVLEITELGRDRIPARCRHYAICGGCSRQDLAYDRQLYYKRKQVVDCMKHIGKIADVTVDETIGAPQEFFYRNKMEFSFNTSPDGGFTLGLHRRRRFNEIFDVEECLLQSELSNRIVNYFREFIAARGIKVYNVDNHHGYVRFLMIRQAKNAEEMLINLVTTEGAMPDQERLVAELTGKFPQIKTIVHNINSKKANIARGEKETVLYGKGYIEEKLLDRRFRIYANSFFQTNTVQTGVLYGRAFEMFKPDDNDVMIDLYCGSGAIGICAAKLVRRVIGIEIEAAATAAATANARDNGIDNIAFHTGSVDKIMYHHPEIFEAATGAIVDPPRAGMNPKALERLAALNLEKIVYISCNPATLARDARRLLDRGYRMEKIVPVDMFPQTTHIEAVTGFYKCN